MPMNIYKSLILTLLPISLLLGCAEAIKPTMSTEQWQKAVSKVSQKYNKKVEQELKPYFAKANINYPPKKLSVLAFKKEKRLELWASDKNNWQHIRDYSLTAFSGHLGPKLKRNDGQIPEGIHKITHFNPFSTLHLSMMLNYPNAFDKQHALLDHRTDLGDNIFIHGKDKSVGCLAIGDAAIDELFVLIDEVGKNNTQVIIAPNDLRSSKPLTSNKNRPRWLASLYAKIKQKLLPFA